MLPPRQPAPDSQGNTGPCSEEGWPETEDSLRTSEHEDGAVRDAEVDRKHMIVT